MSDPIMDNLEEAKRLTNRETEWGRWPIHQQQATTHALIDIAESLRSIVNLLDQYVGRR